MTLFPHYLYLEKNLTKEDLKKIEQLSCNGTQIDGLTSLRGGDEVTSSKVKSNTEIVLNYNDAVQLNEIIYERMDANPEFLDFTAAKSSSCPLLSRMVVGDYYNPHQDNHAVGDFSTTYFLSDPRTYEGGELCLWINGKEERFKPPAGSSLTYKTGIPHRVNTVTKGVRNVAVSWAHSQIKDSFELELYYGLRMLYNKLPHTNCSTLESAMDDPEFLTHNLIEMILRKQNGA